MERFVLAVTAMRWSGNERSLANAILRVVSQPLAPDLQASARYQMVDSSTAKR